MKKISKSQAGFTAVEGLLIVLILVVMGGVGYTVYHNQHKTKPVSQAATTTATNPYAGWSSYTLKYEGANFKYPPNWQLTVEPNASSSDMSDTVRLNGPNNYVLNINTGGLGHPSYDGPASVLDAVPVTFAGQKGYIDYTSTLNDGLVDEISLSKSSTSFLDTFTSKASGENSGNGGNLMVYGQYYDSNYKPLPGQSVSKALTDTNFQNTKLIVESFSY